MSHASKAPGARLGTRRKIGLSSQQVAWPPKDPPGPLLFHEKGLEFAPQQMPGTQSQLGGLAGGIWKTKWKIARVGLDLGPEPRTQPHTHTHTHTHTLNRATLKG